MDGDFLDKWISSALSVTLVSPLESRLSVGWACGALWYLYTVPLSVASSLEDARPIPGRSYLTPLRKFWPPCFSFHCNTGEKILQSIFECEAHCLFNNIKSAMNSQIKLLSAESTHNSTHEHTAAAGDHHFYNIGEQVCVEAVLNTCIDPSENVTFPGTGRNLEIPTAKA